MDHESEEGGRNRWNGWIEEWREKRRNGLRRMGWMDGWIEEWREGRRNVLKENGMDGWMDGGRDGEMD